MNAKNTKKNAEIDPSEIGRLNVAMFKDAKTGKPECLRGVNEHGVPMWSSCRIIDGTLYKLDSVHATMEEAIKRQDELRETTSAQAYRSARAKFTPAGKDTFKASIAVVYSLPYRGAKGIIVRGEPVWPDPIEVEEDDAPVRRGVKKTVKKSAKKSVIVSKGGARIVARPKKVATVVAETDEEEDEEEKDEE